MYDTVYECYEIETTTANEALEWKAIFIHLTETITPSMKDDFLNLLKVFAGKSRNDEKTTVDDPANLITRHIQAKRLTEGNYALSQEQTFQILKLGSVN